MDRETRMELDGTLGLMERLAEAAPKAPSPKAPSPKVPSPKVRRRRRRSPKRSPKRSALPGCLQWEARRRSPVAAPTVGFCVTARDEGADVLATVLSLLRAGADQVVVVDDASEDGCCDGPGFPPEVDIVRREAAVGVSRSRQSGLECLWTDVLATCDGHVEFPEGDALRAAAESAADREAMVCAATKPMAHDQWTAFGASLVFDPKRGAFMVPLDASSRDVRLKRYNGLFGSVYMAPRSVWRRINWAIPNGIYGYNEQTLAMQCWFAGVPVLWDSGLVCRHRLKRSANSGREDSIFENALAAHFALFGGRWYEEWFRPMILERFPGLKGWRPSCELRAWRDRFLLKRCRTDEEFFLDLVNAPLSHEKFFPKRSRDGGGRP